MASIEEIQSERIKKLDAIKKEGINPYPISSARTNAIKEVTGSFKKFSNKKSYTTIAGRIMAIRGQGAIVFVDLYDGTGKIQVLLKKEEMSDILFSRFRDLVDIGDFIECKGVFFTTKRKEETMLVKKWLMLSKSLRPLPDKWHGLQDKEERFRKRYLDVLMSKEVKDRFVVRSKMVSEMRKILDGSDYLEVETPMLQQKAGGASAEPFTTHHNSLDLDLCLRISPELYLKRLIVGGFEKVYEIGRNFRNEGIDATHNPEFTMLEFYESYSDASKQMIFTEKMIKTLVNKLFGKTKTEYKGVKIDFLKRFNRVSFIELLKQEALIVNPESATVEEFTLYAHRLAVEVSVGDSREKIMDSIYKKVCRPKIIQPTFITDYPINMLPLAKQSRNNDQLVDAFQFVAGGIEIVKAFSELNDPIEQMKRFENQEKNKKKGDKEAQESDREFLEAMEYGMPPIGGVGIGIDRLAMFFTDSENIKEVILFPTMRPIS